MKFNLVEFIDGAYQNSRRVLAEDPNVESLLQDITDAYSTALALPEVRHERRAIFIAMSHASFLGAVQLATSGQLPPSYMASRGALEAAIYAWWVKTKPDLMDIWIHRDDDDESEKKMTKAFKMVHMRDALRKHHIGIEKQFGTAYKTTITLGAHPNWMSFWTNLADLDGEGGQVFRYVNPDEASVNQAMHTTAFSAITSLFLFSFTFETPFATVGFRPYLVGLLNRLFARFPEEGEPESGGAA